MSIEQKVNQLLQKAPGIKKVIKRSYQLGMYAISPKIKSEGMIKRVTPEDKYEYFFGYYDKSPWDATERYMLAMRAAKTNKDVAPKETVDIVLIDLEKENEVIKVAETKAWNVQQGAMLQWLGPDFSREILFNDYRNGQYVSVIVDVDTREERVLSAPVYSVAASGKYALTLDFARLHRLRPGYGYSWLEDQTKDQSVPESPAIWRIDLEQDQVTPLFTYKELYEFETRDEMVNAEHKVNHIMLNPSADRFMVLHRWVSGGKRYTRLLTANSDGSGLYNLSDDNMASHSYWKNDQEIISYLRKEKEGNGYFLLEDQSSNYKQILREIASVGDGHPSISPDGEKLVTDTYPNRSRIQTVYVADVEKDKIENIETVAKVFAPFKYDNDVRCDLHPRWNPSSSKVAIDATFEGKRGLYVIDVR